MAGVARGGAGTYEAAECNSADAIFRYGYLCCFLEGVRKRCEAMAREASRFVEERPG